VGGVLVVRASSLGLGSVERAVSQKSWHLDAREAVASKQQLVTSTRKRSRHDNLCRTLGRHYPLRANLATDIYLLCAPLHRHYFTPATTSPTFHHTRPHLPVNAQHPWRIVPLSRKVLGDLFCQLQAASVRPPCRTPLMHSSFKIRPMMPRSPVFSTTRIRATTT
jgi:hypothetical protein